MCYGMHCGWERSNGTCDPSLNYPCRRESMKKKEAVSFYLTSEFNEEFEWDPDKEDIFDIIMEYVHSKEFMDKIHKNTLEKKCHWEVELS